MLAGRDLFSFGILFFKPFYKMKIEKKNLSEKFKLITEYYKPKISGELNDNFIKLAKLKGEFIWHRHENEDELFLVVKGNLLLKLRDDDIEVGEGEFIVIPKGVEHKPVAKEEVYLLLIEPKSTLNTGNIENDMTVKNLDWV
jgi:mannose-6-phosphate isomerase-like protein (cupin superfamily)